MKFELKYVQQVIMRTSLSNHTDPIATAIKFNPLPNNDTHVASWTLY